MPDMSASITYWQDASDGKWLGYWNDYPDWQTEGYDLDDLKRMLVSLRQDIREMIADGTLTASPKNVTELAFA